MRLRTNIASPLLLDCLRKIMASKAFDDLYLVGGTALALQRGHRISIDIDMFTNALYGEMKTDKIKSALVEMFPYVDRLERLDETLMVYSLFVGNSSDDCVKLDICYDENPIFPIVNIVRYPDAFRKRHRRYETQRDSPRQTTQKGLLGHSRPSRNLFY